MKKYFLTSKGQFLKTSFALACAILISIFLVSPLQNLNANIARESSNIENQESYCPTGWVPEETDCSCTSFNLVCSNYRIDRKYIFCTPMGTSTDETRSIFTGISFGKCDPVTLP
ncbi:hypothetical protein [Aquimarina macrocephali]|uniref:hypothetical protein n=1 Tax=Aquimarina macrocephali TaxID=666563 RepID=UPI00046726CC|nr:hypothetical protein [Aquimarina macrocephali]